MLHVESPNKYRNLQEKAVKLLFYQRVYINQAVLMKYQNLIIFDTF